MKFELKTENENYSKFFSHFFGIVFVITLLIILFDIALKLRFVSKHYEIEYNCKLLSVEKSSTNFEKLSRLSSLKSKQQIWEFCREVLKKN
ncbi:hypothetical protein OAZ97_02595 [Prochlorococcus sp. AH-736-E15]|nr:hypothetical protein [Prochlorococcus sp. AH-736-E15]